MSVTNKESHIVCVRTKHAHRTHLEKKAKANPVNARAKVGTEINALIAADYEFTRRTGKFKFK